MDKRSILVTGGAGFIGSNFVKYMLREHPDYNITVLDKLTYAGSLANLEGCFEKICFSFGDICDYNKVREILVTRKITDIVHFAAESHVDNSIVTPMIFTQTNIVGTHILLEAAKCTWGEGSENKFVHISTDEVYGSTDGGLFTETSEIKPSSPYSASKASSDLIALTYAKTYKMNICVTNCSNNYGPNQHEEKLIPHVIKQALAFKPIPVYGTGKNVRDWIYVDDHCRAIDAVLQRGRRGERYNIGANCENENLEIIKYILSYLNRPESLINYVSDRKGHDFRYAIDNSKIKQELNWIPQVDFLSGLNFTIEWYKNKFENS